jgi:hypothetical protein
VIIEPDTNEDDGPPGTSKGPPDALGYPGRKFRLIDKTREISRRGFGLFCAQPPQPRHDDDLRRGAPPE